jgi:type I restriction enzyme S subunit
MIRKLSDICTITKGDIGIMKAIPGDYAMITLGEENKTHNQYQFDAKAVVIPLVSSTGHGHASMKRVKYFEGKFALGNILCAVIPKDESQVNAKYLHIYLHENRERLLVSLMKGAANVSLPIKRLDNVEVIIPSMERQLEIVELEKIISGKSRMLFDEFETQTQLISQLRQSILQEAIQGKLTEAWRKENKKIEPASELLKRIKAEKDKTAQKGKKTILPEIKEDEIPFVIPENWAWSRLGDIFQSTSGGTPTKGNHKYWNGNIQWYKSGELNDGLLEKDSEEKITQDGLNESSATLFPKGTLLIAMYGATAGKLSILNREATTNQAVCGFYENGLINTLYLFYFLMANRSKMIEDSWGMSQPNISQTYLRNFVFAVPPLSEQQAVVDKVENLLSKCALLQTEIEHLNTHSKTLLKALFNESFAAEATI